MIVTYIQWKDASHSLSEWEIEKIEPSLLSEVGFLLRETDDAVTLGIEAPDGSDTSTRLWLCIPKVNIMDRRDMELEKAFPVRRKRR